MDEQLQAILEAHKESVEAFKNGGELDQDLESDLWDYHFNRGTIRNYGCDASAFIADHLSGYLGVST